MITCQLRTVMILLTAALGANTAWSSQSGAATSAMESHATTPKAATEKPAESNRTADRVLPGIVDEEDIPAFLRMDPCDTEDL